MLFNATTSTADKIALGGLTAFIGIGVVFFMLLILVGIVTYLPKVNLDFKKGKKPIKNDDNITQKSEIISLDDNNNDELIAAITAALSIVLSSENGQRSMSRAPFVVKSIKRI